MSYNFYECKFNSKVVLSIFFLVGILDAIKQIFSEDTQLNISQFWEK